MLRLWAIASILFLIWHLKVNREKGGTQGREIVGSLSLAIFFCISFFSAVCVDINQATSKFYHDLLNKAMRPEIRPLHTLQSHTIAK